jgi:hypothetical protein
MYQDKDRHQWTKKQVLIGELIIHVCPAKSKIYLFHSEYVGSNPPWGRQFMTSALLWLNEAEVYARAPGATGDTEVPACA